MPNNVCVETVKDAAIDCLHTATDDYVIILLLTKIVECLLANTENDGGT